MRSPIDYDLVICVASFQTIPLCGIEPLARDRFPSRTGCSLHDRQSSIMIGTWRQRASNLRTLQKQDQFSLALNGLIGACASARTILPSSDKSRRHPADCWRRTGLRDSRRMCTLSRGRRASFRLWQCPPPYASDLRHSRALLGSDVIARPLNTTLLRSDRMNAPQDSTTQSFSTPDDISGPPCNSGQISKI